MNRDIGLPNEYLLLRDYLKVNFGGRNAAGGKECVIRCPFCGDSSDQRSAHLYVGVNRRRNDVISYNCFRCNASGDVSRAFFSALRITNQDVINPVLTYNQSRGANIYAKMSRHVGGYGDYKRLASTNNTIIPIKDSPEYVNKLAYINNRLGIWLTLYDLIPYRIILNLKDFLDMNGIRTYTRDPRIIQELSEKFLGFLSVDGSHVTLRRLVDKSQVHPSLEKRYSVYSIKDNDLGMVPYCIREAIDPAYPNSVIICEGPFDALSIHCNLLYPYMNKVIFASCGKSAKQVLEYLVLRKSLPLFNTTFHIYMDNDLTMQEIYALRKLFRDYNLPVVLHHNLYPGEKDYGVPLGHIIDGIY